MSQVDATLLSEWCERWLGAVPRELMFERGHISQVIGATLSNGRQVVIKIRPGAARISGCIAVQRSLFSAGFPCPEPLAGPAPLGAQVATAEAFVPGGAALGGNAEAATLFASLLADLVSKAPAPSAIPSLDPAPPWVGWDHDESGIWPWPDDLALDLNDHAGPAWLDELGAGLRVRLSESHAHPVVGHVDWESHNIGWSDTTPLVVHDWDSVAALDELAIAGAASAVFPSSPDGRVVAANTQQSTRFLDVYQAARGIRWSIEEQTICWAAGLWVLAYNAKKETLGGGIGYLRHLEGDAGARMQRAGM